MPEPLPAENYETLRESLKDLPATFYPDLIGILVEASYAKNVWLPGGCGFYVHRIEKAKGFDKPREEKPA